jgi:7-cyano-7-deazaguanine synthase
MSRSSSIAVLVSGGLDSDVLLAEMAERYARVFPIYVRQNLKWEKEELYWLRRFLRVLHKPAIKKLHVLSLPMEDLYGAHWSLGRGRTPGARTRDAAVYLPGRNLILTLKAGIFCALEKIPVIALGSLGHNPFPDASPAFFKRWAAAMGQGLATRVKIIAPFRSMSKTEVIRRGRHLPLEFSFSCIAPQRRRHCGRCNKCAERKRAFRLARVPDPTRYAR